MIELRKVLDGNGTYYRLYKDEMVLWSYPLHIDGPISYEDIEIITNICFSEGYHQGRNEGKREGYENGFDTGYSEGRE